MKNYDQILSRKFNEETQINYGVAKGNNDILFIKVGQGGNIKGFKNKYIKIASRIKKYLGYTIIVSDNKYLREDIFDYDMQFIKEYSKENGFEVNSIKYLGVSNGGSLGIINSYKEELIDEIVIINSPLLVNWHKLKDGLEKMGTKKVVFIYGDQDPSYLYTKKIEQMKNEKKLNFELKIVYGADHNFTDLLDDFIELPVQYLRNFKKEKEL